MKKNNITNLAIIPARGGSKRLKNKNLQLLGGKPLLAHTIEAAIGSKYISNIIVSSDSDEILEISKKYEVNIHKRPKDLSSDTATALELVKYLFQKSNSNFDFITLMLPTCPFRNSLHVDEGMQEIEEDDDGVISVTSYNFPVELSVPVSGKYINLEENSPLITGNTRSQNHKPTFRPNGGYYISRWDSFKKYQNFWKGKVKFYEMSIEDSVDVDTRLDLDFAENIIRNRGDKN